MDAYKRNALFRIASMSASVDHVSEKDHGIRVETTDGIPAFPEVALDKKGDQRSKTWGDGRERVRIQHLSVGQN